MWGTSILGQQGDFGGPVVATVKTCDRCGGSPAFRAVLNLMDGRKYRSSYSTGDLCDKCAKVRAK